MKIARDAITGMTAEAEIGKIYRGKVVTIKEFGAFVEFLPGKDGLVHISELANFRVKQTEDIVKMGDEIWVKCLGVDEKGRVRLSRRAAMAERDQQMGGTGTAEVEKQEANPPLRIVNNPLHAAIIRAVVNEVNLGATVTERDAVTAEGTVVETGARNPRARDDT
jgi:predicted RNA-binding protein with RPS1 domain